MDSLHEASADAEQDTTNTIEEAGKKNLRNVQNAQDEALDKASDKLKEDTQEKTKGAVDAIKEEGEESKQQLESEAKEADKYMKDSLNNAASHATSFYITAAKTQMGDLKNKMTKSGRDMIAQLRNTIAVGGNAERTITKMAIKAEVKANYSNELWEKTQMTVLEAQRESNHTEDAVRTSAIGTKFSSQAVSKAKKESTSAYELATEANITGNTIMKKVMSTKAGIVDVTTDVLDALQKAEKANLDAHQADLVATKLYADSQKVGGKGGEVISESALRPYDRSGGGYYDIKNREGGVRGSG